MSSRDEERIKRLGKLLGVRSKAGVVRLAVVELERAVARQERTHAIREYVRRYGHLDRTENIALSAGGVARDDG